jgi:hypothetical protein
VNQSLFRGDVTYQGVANLALLEIQPDANAPVGQANFGGIRMGNVQFFSTHAFTGIYAPDVNVQTTATIGDVSAYDDATPALLFGDASQFGTLTVAGGDLQQPNGRAIQTKGFAGLALVPGTSSVGVFLPQQTLSSRVERNGVDVTSSLVGYSAAAAAAAAVAAATTGAMNSAGVATSATQSATAAAGSSSGSVATGATPVTTPPPPVTTPVVIVNPVG